MSFETIRPVIALLCAALLAGCMKRPAPDEHADHPPTVVLVPASPAAASPPASASTVTSAAPQTPVDDRSIPAGAELVAARIAASPRHAEWAMVPVEGGDSVRVWVVYPERSTNAPVVVVVHEIFGLSTWVRGVADQLAADGFIAIAPDYLTGKTTVPADSLTMDAGRALIRGLDPLEIVRRTAAAADYGMSRPAALQRYGVVGFCWGGGVVFEHAARTPNLGAGVAYYGAPGQSTPLADTKAAVLALYGENDARVNASIPRVDSTMRAAGRSFEHQIFPGAGHGFLRQQSGAAGANLAASRAAWPRTLSFFRTHLGQ